MIALTVVLVLGGGCGRSDSASGVDDGREGLVEVRRLDGRVVDPFAGRDSRAMVLVFLGAECPISNRYVPELLRLRERFQGAGIRFWMVYADVDLTIEVARRHAGAYGLGGDVLLDPGHLLVARAGAKITPEAVVFVAGGRMVYRGRIDNRHADLARARPEATERDLERVLEAVRGGKEIAFSEKPAVGCYIEPGR